MSDKTKSRLVTVAIIIAIVFLWLWLRRIPAVQQAVQQTASDLGLPDVGGLLPVDKIGLNVPDLDIGDYIPRDEALPVLNDTSDRFSPCNFCIQSRADITVPSPPAVVAPAPAAVAIAARSRAIVTWSQPAPPPAPFNWGPIGALGMGYIPGIF